MPADRSVVVFADEASIPSKPEPVSPERPISVKLPDVTVSIVIALSSKIPVDDWFRVLPVSASSKILPLFAVIFALTSMLPPYIDTGPDKDIGELISSFVDEVDLFSVRPLI